MKNNFVATYLPCLVLFCACSTAPISSLQPIVVPRDLTVAEVKSSIAKAASLGPVSQSQPAYIGNGSPARAVIISQMIQGSHATWYVEQIRESSVVLGGEHEKQYIRVEYVIADDTIVPHVVSSRNLKQSSTAIDEDVIDWTSELALRIRHELGEALASRTLR